MNAWIESMAYWLADYYLAATVLFVAALVAMGACRQPAKRLAVAKAALVAAALLAALCALPGWSVVSLGGVDASEASVASLAAQPAVTPTIELPRFEEAMPIAPSAAPLSRPAAAEVKWNWNIPWLTLLVTGFFVGCAAVALWLVVGVIAAARLVRRADWFPDTLRDALRDVAGVGELLVSKEVDVPVALGVFRPRVILPLEWIETRTSAELSTVLAHEAAHIRNGDLWWLAASRLLLVVLWAQPLYWLLRRRMRLDQETLADAAAAEVAGRQAYAEQLVAWARDVVARPRPLLPASVGLWEGASQLRRRVAVLMDERFAVMRRCSRVWLGGSMTLAMSLTALLSTLTMAPAARVANAALEENQASSRTETQHLSLGGGGVSSFVTGYPATPWDYEPNAVRLEVEDVDEKPVAGVEATLFRVSQATGEREQVRELTGNEEGVVEFSDVVADEVAHAIKTKLKEGQFPGRVSDVFYIVLQQPQLGTVILPVSDFSVASRGSKRRVRMMPAAELTGRVTDQEGKPVSGATVAVGSLGGVFALEGANATVSDSNGEFHFANLSEFNRDAAMKRAAERGRDALAVTENRERDYPAIYDPAEDFAASDLVATHADLAMTRVEGGNIPGKANVVMKPEAAIEGQVVEFGTGKAAAGVLVKAVGRIPIDGQETVFQPVGLLPLYGRQHAANTRTDAEGRYRLSNLPEGTYEVWAEPRSKDWREIDWVSTIAGDLQLTAGAAKQAPYLAIGPGGTIRGRLVDAATRERVAPADKNARVRAMFHFVDGVNQQQQLLQEVPVGDDGTFMLRTFPTPARLFVDVGTGLQLSDTEASEYRSPDDFYRSGQVFELSHGESVDADVPVMRTKQLLQARELVLQGFESLRANGLAKAIGRFSEAIAISPDDTSALGGRARAYDRSGDFAGAIGDFERLVKLEPDVYVWSNNLADLLATSPNAADRDGARAVELAKRSIALAEGAKLPAAAQAEFLDTLAAAEAEAGDFAAAVKTEREAIEKAGDVAKAEMRKRLEVYEAGRAWRREGEGD